MNLHHAKHIAFAESDKYKETFDTNVYVLREEGSRNYINYHSNGMESLRVTSIMQTTHLNNVAV